MHTDTKKSADLFAAFCKPWAAFSKLRRKILGKLLILGATGRPTQVATSSRRYSATGTVEHCTNRPINSVQRSNRKLCSSSSKIRSFSKIFLGAFENVAPGFKQVLSKFNPIVVCDLVFDSFARRLSET